MRAGILTIALGLATLGCNGGKATVPYVLSSGGDAHRGRELIQGYGCGACHMIPGIREANGLVGPPLWYLNRRTIIAGELPNSPANLALWIEHPRSVNPKTAMPDLGLDEQQARDIVAYLYSLNGSEGRPWTE